MNRKLAKGWLVWAGMAASASFAAAQDVQVFAKPHTDLGVYQTYSWDSQRAFRSAPDVERAMQYVERELSAKGWHLVASGGDLTVSPLFGPAPADNANFPGWTGFAPAGGQRSNGSSPVARNPTVKMEQLGVLVTDPHSHETLWRGTIRDTSTNSTAELVQFDHEIGRILASFPSPKK
jgi:hypothetical protein